MSPLNHKKLSVYNTEDDAIAFLIDHFVKEVRAALKRHAWASIALSGGSTPKKFYQALIQNSDAQKLEWKNICLFWSDERSVAPTHPDSNFKMASEFFDTSPFNEAKIFRMQAEQEERNIAAREYEALIQKYCYDGRFDIVYLGLGDDGHTASLFPNTEALTCTNKLVVPNYIESKNTWRMTLTFECINESRNIVVLCFGSSKAQILKKVLADQSDLPASRLGTEATPALFVTDSDAAALCSF